MNYYNEIEPYAVEWLRNLMDAGLIGTGIVDDRDIRTLDHDTARGFTRAHFFAGIAGWELALQLAEWPEDRPVWTGSCPCQPFSVAGKRKGNADDRHLWPVWREHIRVCQPATVIGEQTASAAGREWVTGVRLDLEALGYAVGIADLAAAGVGAPHIRQRLYWVAVTGSQHAWGSLSGPGESAGEAEEWSSDQSGRPGGTGGLGFSGIARLERHAGNGDDGSQPGRQFEIAHRSITSTGAAVGVDVSDPHGLESERQSQYGNEQSPFRLQRDRSGAGGFWNWAGWLACGDGKARRTQPGLQPLAHGVPARVAKLRAYGNAIVPQLAAAFIRAFLSAESDLYRQQQKENCNDNSDDIGCHPA